MILNPGLVTLLHFKGHLLPWLHKRSRIQFHTRTTHLCNGLNKLLRDKGFD